jgi:hypothetical protein
MSVLMSWARSTLANVEHALARGRGLDRILIGAAVLVVVAILLIVLQ